MAKRPSKITLQIENKLTPEDELIPFELSYNDESFEIENPAKSMKLFDGAVRWRCSIDGRKVEILNLDNKWWMEKS